MRAGRARPRTNYDHVARELGIDIISGRYPENALLPGDSELLARFQVSRTVLREALKTLSAKGLIQAKAKVGTRVLERRFWNLFDPEILYWHAEAGIGTEFLLSLGEMRLALESKAAALAANRRSPEQVVELYKCVELMARTDQTGMDFVESDLGFHVCVAEASGNPFMRSITAIIEVALATTFQFSSPVLGSAEHRIVVERHRAVADAIAKRNEQGARESMRVVVGESIERLKENLGKDGVWYS
jgi:DNA-binding FadR family transcriptional regulator